ncbi:formimidoylglutamase [Halalkalibacillus halophilus]|uniref:formimidoylglutamase n=1 Tax=Halalkalibacillus halophilus TaxID=392827 RepID=UPI0003F6C254|nr:formimidoylglutamase [Halalkalibacillus halophilus]
MDNHYLKLAGQAKFVDSNVTKFNEILKGADGQKRQFGLVGAPLSKPSISHSGASFAPGAIREAMASYSTYSNESGYDFKNDEITDFGDITMHPTDIVASQERIFTSVRDILSREEAEFHIVLGGDHSISYPAIKAFQEKYGRVGLLQFDAHHDLRNLEDGGPTNGTPFRRAIENQVLLGEDIVQIGIRDFTNAKAYDDYAHNHGVSVHTMEDVEKGSIDELIDKEMSRLAEKVDFIYITVDIDVLDQAYAPGCPAIGPGGMDSKTLLQAIKVASKHQKAQAIDFVEIDPTLDFRNMTSRVAAYGIFQFIKAKIL